MGSEFVTRKSSVWGKKSDTKPSLFTSRSFSDPTREDNKVSKKELPSYIPPPNFITAKMGFKAPQPVIQRDEENSQEKESEQETDVNLKSDVSADDDENKVDLKADKSVDIPPPNYIFAKMGYKAPQPVIQRQEENSQEKEPEQEADVDVSAKSDVSADDEENKVDLKADKSVDIPPPNYIFAKMGYKAPQPVIQREEENSQEKESEQETDVNLKSDVSADDDENKQENINLKPHPAFPYSNLPTVQRQEDSDKKEQEDSSLDLKSDEAIQTKCSECESEEQREEELVQTKLTVGEPGDKYEQEADAVAAKVVEQINSPSSEQTVQGKIEPVVTQVIQSTSNNPGLQLTGQNQHQGNASNVKQLSGAIEKAVSNKQSFRLPSLQSENGSETEGTTGTGVGETSETAEVADNRSSDAPPEAQQATQEIDRGDITAKKNELLAEEETVISKANKDIPQAEQATQAASEKVNEPTESIVEASSEASVPEESTNAAEVGAAANTAAGLAEQVDTEEPLSLPEPPSEVVPPEVTPPVDAGGETLPSNSEADAQITNLAHQAQSLRQGGHHLQAQAAQARTNAQIVRGNLQRIKQGISQSEQGVETSASHLQARQELVGQAEQALQISEKKANTVAEQAPGFVEKADEGKEESGAMAEGANELAAENASQTPEDPEAGAKAQEQGQKLNQVGSDTATVDDAVTQTKDKAGSLAEEAAQAKATNAETETKITTMKETLGQTNERLSQMREQNAQAQSQVEGFTDQPNQMAGKADDLDRQGQELIQASIQIEQQLQQVQTSYLQEMSAVPAAETSNEGEVSAETAIQRDTDENGIDVFGSAEEGRYDERETVDLAGALPSWVTGVDPATEEQRQQAQQQAEQRRQQQIQQINEMAGGNFENLNAGQKVGIALQLTGQNIANSISKIQWPSWGQLAQGLLDPRATLTGVISGLSMMLSGGANLLNAEQWAQDPLGNLLKSSADIATGLTVILGSITALAGLIIGIMGAITLVSLGTAAPVTGPIIAFCTTVMTTVGGWTIFFGKVALVLQALVLIKNLIDAATAETAEQLQNQSDQITQDVANAGNVVMQIGGAKLAKVGGRQMQTKIAKAKGGVRFAAQMGARGLPNQVRSAGGVRAYAGALRRGARARVAAAGSRRAFVAQGGRRALAGARDAARRTWRELRDEAPEGLSARQGFSREHLVGDDIPSGSYRSRTRQIVDEERALAEDLFDSTRSRTTPTSEPDVIPDSTTPPRDGGETPAPRNSDETADISDTTSESTSARESSVRDSGHIESDQISDRQIRNELDHIGDNPDLVEGTPPNRRAKIGDHEWQEQPSGGWCRHSDKKVCVPGSSSPTPSRQGGADESSQAGQSTVSGRTDSTGERLTIENSTDVQRFRDNPPTKPANLTPEEDVLWDNYIDYYNKRLDAIDTELASGNVISDPPRNWESYVEARSRLRAAERGSAFQQRVTDDAQVEGFDVQQNVGVSRTPNPRRRSGRGQGEIKFPDQLIVDEHSGHVIATSNKSRDFSNLPSITRQVEADVDDLIQEYSGQLYVRRRGHQLRSSEPVYVQEIVLVYDNSLVPNAEIRNTIARIAERRAHQTSPNLVFWITFE